MAKTMHGKVSTGIPVRGRWWKENILGRSVCLTKIEHRLLRYLMDRPNQLISKEELLHAVWQYEWVECTGVVEVYICRLRQKIEENPEKPRYIINQRGYGYQFVAEPLSRSQPIQP